jgi:WD40 repeat protein
MYTRVLFCFYMFMVMVSIPVSYAEGSDPSLTDQDVYINALQDQSKYSDDAIKKRACTIVSLYAPEKIYPRLRILHPFNGALFPRDMASPLFTWDDATGTTAWLIMIDFNNAAKHFYVLTDRNEWTPEKKSWERIKENSLNGLAQVTILGLGHPEEKKIFSRGSVTISTSSDAVDARILFHQMSPPFSYAVLNQNLFKWRLADISSYDDPQTIPERNPSCKSCHYHSAFNNWKNKPSANVLPRVSPNGKYMVKTVNEKALFIILPDIAYSEVFVHIKGKLGFSFITDETFHELPGANHLDYVQTGATWSPDGNTIVFSRALVDPKLLEVMGKKSALIAEHRVSKADLNAVYQFQYDLYRIPFNNGEGGTPEPVKGASGNGMSNYFPRFSPDNQWIIFTRATTGFLLEPESKLFIIPAEGGTARKMKCNLPRHNSWHSFSPNGRWLIFTSKFKTPYTKLFITHIDENGNDSPPIFLSRFSTEKMAVIAPEFITLQSGL